MKTLADFKRRLTIGTKLTYEFHRSTTIVGNLGNTVIPASGLQARVVSRLQSNGVWFMRADGKESWLDWPKAKDLIFVDDNTVTVCLDGVPSFTYKFL